MNEDAEFSSQYQSMIESLNQVMPNNRIDLNDKRTVKLFAIDVLLHIYDPIRLAVQDIFETLEMDIADLEGDKLLSIQESFVDTMFYSDLELICAD